MRNQVVVGIVVVACGICMCAGYAHAGAWTLPKYKVWAEEYQKWSWADETYTGTGAREPMSNDAKYWDYVNEPKLEFGVTDWLTALGSVEYKQEHYKEYGRPNSWGTFAHSNNGFTYVKVGGRLRFMQKPFVLSTQTKVFIYAGYGVNHGEEYDRNIPSLGYGDDAYEQRILIGKVFDIPFKEGKIPAYFGAETGYRIRTRHVANDVPVFVETGFWPVKWFLLSTEVDGYLTTAGSGCYKESYLIWRVGGTWEVFGGDAVLRKGNKLFNLQVQYGVPFYGRNSNAGHEWVFKIDTQF